MQIREQGRSIKLLRVEHNNATRRDRQVVIGSFRIDGDVPAELLEQLSGSERRELAQWLSAWRDNQEMERSRAALAGASVHLDELVAALDVAAGLLTPAEADLLWRKVQAIARGLRRGGHPRPKRTVSSAVPFPGQLDLIDELDTDR